MTDAARFILSGYISPVHHGFALPCFLREGGGNAWHAAVPEVPGDKLSQIVGFESLDCPKVELLDEPLRRSVAARDVWQDVFIWGTRISVGGRHEILADIDDLMAEISEGAPLTAFDAAFDMGQDDAALVARASEWLNARHGADVALQTLGEAVIGHVAGLRVRRWACWEGWGFSPSRRDVAIVARGSSAFALRLSDRTRLRLEAGGNILELVAELRALAAVAGVELIDTPELAFASDNMATPTYDRRLRRRFADFETLGEALDYAALGARGLNFHDPRGNLARRYPFCELREEALAQAYRLIAAGVKPGDRIALVAETSPEFASLFFGAVYAGALPVPLPLPTSFGGRDAYVGQLVVQLTSCDPKLLLFPSDLEYMTIDAADTRGVEPLDWSEFSGRQARETSLPHARSSDIAYLQYSSGATRLPQGVALNHAAVLSNLAARAHGIALQESDRCISWLPWYHDIGLVGGLLLAVTNQVSADFLKTEDFARRPLAWLDLVSRNKSTSVTFSPTFGYDICARRISSQIHPADRFDLSRWRVAGNGADMIRPDVLQHFVDTFGSAGFSAKAFLPSYGLAEATQAVSLMPPGEGVVVQLVGETEPADMPSDRRGAKRYRAVVNCGKPVRGMEVEIRSAAGQALAGESIGKIWCRGASVMEGYFRDPDATAACLLEGWLDTGDMGFLADGYIYVVGRAKDMILIDGRNYWPEEIEWTLEQLPGFKSGDIAAFAMTQSSGDDVPVVLVQCRTSDETERHALREMIRERVRAVTGLASVVELIPPRTLPRTSSGKLSRSKARAQYLAGEIQAFAMEA